MASLSRHFHHNRFCMLHHPHLYMNSIPLFRTGQVSPWLRSLIECVPNIAVFLGTVFAPRQLLSSSNPVRSLANLGCIRDLAKPGIIVRHVSEHIRLLHSHVLPRSFDAHQLMHSLPERTLPYCFLGLSWCHYSRLLARWKWSWRCHQIASSQFFHWTSKALKCQYKPDLGRCWTKRSNTSHCFKDI